MRTTSLEQIDTLLEVDRAGQDKEEVCGLVLQQNSDLFGCCQQLNLKK